MRKITNVRKKGLAMIATIAAVFVINCTVPIYAANDNIGYSFEIKANYKNSYSSSRYRQTKNTDNKWKVNMTYSGEGKGTVTTYWLAKDNFSRTRVSDTHDVKQGSGAHYYKAYKSASDTKVRLGAENNNDSSKTYTVSGYWDEETK